MNDASATIDWEYQVQTFAQFVKLNRRVDRHRGAYIDWLDRHEHACSLVPQFGLAGLNEICEYLYQRIRDERNVLNAFDYVAEHSGHTAGADRMTVNDIPDKFEFCRAIRDDIDSGYYIHGETRVIPKRKSSGVGTRPIQIPNLWDRVVHRSVLQVIGPLLDLRFSDLSFGGRPGRNRCHALAAAEKLAGEGRRFWICCDLANAFETVPQARLLQILKKLLPVRPSEEIKRRPWNQKIHENLHSLLGKIIKTPKGVGIRQGAATSNLFMNIYADKTIDRPWQRRSGASPILRYSDDILIPCESLGEAELALERLKKLLLPTGLRLKEPQAGEKNIVDLDQGETANWLGFRISWRCNAMDVRAGLRASKHVYDEITRPSADEDAAQGDVVRNVIGSLQEMGPAYLHSPRKRIHSYLWRLAQSNGISCFPDFDEFEAAWSRAHVRWEKIRQSVRDGSWLAPASVPPPPTY
jgi:retron-type reverse transcriptase